MRRFFSVLALVFLAVGFSSANASLEVRLHYGQLSGDGGDYNSKTQGLTTAWPKAESPSVAGADVLFFIPVVGFGVGVRYESLLKQEATGGTFKDSNNDDIVASHEISGSRTSLLLGYRFIDTLGYVGALAHYGLAKDIKYKLTFNNTTDSVITPIDYEATMDASYGVGLEGGAKFGLFMVGGEVGYTILKAKSVAYQGNPLQDASSKNIPIDFSGMYYRVVFGLSFL